MYSVPDSFPCNPNPFYVFDWVRADLHFDRVSESLLDPSLQDFRHQFRFLDITSSVDVETILGPAAQQLVDWNVKPLAEEVIQREIDGALCGWIQFNSLVHLPMNSRYVLRIFAYHEWPQILLYEHKRGFNRLSGYMGPWSSFTDTHKAVIGEELDYNVLRYVLLCPRSGKGLLHR